VCKLDGFEKVQTLVEESAHEALASKNYIYRVSAIQMLA